MLIRNSSPLLTVLDGITIDPPELSGVLRQVGISENLLSMPDARVTQEQFSTLFQSLVEKLDASNLQTAIRRWQQFDHILSDHFSFGIQRASKLISLSIKRYPSDAKNPRLVQEFHLGFANVTVFHRTFKLWTGGTPRACRKGRSDSDP